MTQQTRSSMPHVCKDCLMTCNLRRKKHWENLQFLKPKRGRIWFALSPTPKQFYLWRLYYSGACRCGKWYVVPFRRTFLSPNFRIVQAEKAHLHLVPKLRMGWTIPSFPPHDFMARTGPTFLLLLRMGCLYGDHTFSSGVYPCKVQGSDTG